MAVSYVGPWSPEVYETADQIQSGGSGVPYSPSIISAAQNVISTQPTQQSTIAPTGGNPPPAPTGDTGSGNAGVSGPSSGQVMSNISASYDPIFSELDRRIGMLPEQEAALNQQVGDLATYQTGVATSAKEGEVQDLGEAKTQEETTSKRTLDEFSTDLADLLRKIGGIYGGSSGAEAVGAAVGKEGTRTRGRLLEARDTAYRAIEMKLKDVDRAFNDQVGKIEMWKSTQLANISTEIQNRLSEIEGQKAGASTAKAQQLANMAQEMYFSAQTYLQNLDMMTHQYKLSMDNWRQTRETQLNEWLGQVKETGETTPTTYSYQSPTLSGGGPVQSNTTQYQPIAPTTGVVGASGQITNQTTGGLGNEFTEENPWGTGN